MIGAAPLRRQRKGGNRDAVEGGNENAVVEKPRKNGAALQESLQTRCIGQHGRGYFPGYGFQRTEPGVHFISDFLGQQRSGRELLHAQLMLQFIAQQRVGIECY